MYTLEGVSSVANFIIARENSIKPRLLFLSVMYSLFPKEPSLGEHYENTHIQIY